MKTKKLILSSILIFTMLFTMTACSVLLTDKQIEEYALRSEENNTETSVQKAAESEETAVLSGDTRIQLSDDGILVDGKPISNNVSSKVYAANDIVFYLAGQDITYGDGEERDEHSQEEADEYKVVHIGEPGTYYLSGNLSKGQIAVDLGDEAADDRNAVVNLVLDNADISCDIAPAVIFYNVYECGKDDMDPLNTDLSDAGANIFLTDGSVNNLKGAYVAKIYKSYELNKKGTKVKDSEKLHKYDAALFSRMSMNISGGEEGTGQLNINAVNEGIGSDRHIAFNGGAVNIVAGNDAVNASDNDKSVIIINDGIINAMSDGSYVGGDGIDSNGWIVVNGGTVNAQASPDDENAGIDSSKEIYLNGGTVNATGNVLEKISKDSKQNYVIFEFREKQHPNDTYSIVNADGINIFSFIPDNPFYFMVMSSDNIREGQYSFYYGNSPLFIFEETSEQTEENIEENPTVPEEPVPDISSDIAADTEVLPDNEMYTESEKKNLASGSVQPEDNNSDQPAEIVEQIPETVIQDPPKKSDDKEKQVEKISFFRLVKGHNYIILTRN